jgi:hypothetical protein
MNSTDSALNMTSQGRAVSQKCPGSSGKKKLLLPPSGWERITFAIISEQPTAYIVTIERNRHLSTLCINVLPPSCNANKKATRFETTVNVCGEHGVTAYEIQGGSNMTGTICV